MLSVRRFLPLAATALFVAPGVRAVAVFETPGWALQNFGTAMDQYNLMTLNGNATFTNAGFSQGGLAINGDLSLAGGTFGSSAAGTDPSLYVTGTLTVSGTSILRTGNASLLGETTANFSWNRGTHKLSAKDGSGALTATKSSDPLTTAGPANWNWTNEAATFQIASASLAGLSNTGTISVVGGALTFSTTTTPTAGSIVGFTLDAGSLSAGGTKYGGTSFTTVSISVPADANYVINVVNGAGTTLFGSGVTMGAVANSDNLLWNLEGSSGTVTLGGGNFSGSVLAPLVGVNSGGANLTGQVAAASFTDNAKALDFSAFQNMAAVVAPEPETCAIWGVALCAGALAARRLVGRPGKTGFPAVP